MEYKSRFTGGAFANFFISLLAGLVSIITLGLAYPAMKCWYIKWNVKNTYYNDKRLTFDGNGGQLFGKYILWLLLSVITLGIYYLFAMRVNLKRWEVKHTHFEGIKKESKFTGSAFGYFGVNLLTGFITIITLGIGSFWAHCFKERWFAKNQIIDGYEIDFDGKAIQYFGKRIVWILLTIITIGIYSFWLAVKSKKWTISHTFVKGNIDEDIANGLIEFEQEDNSTSSTWTPAQKFSILGLIFAFIPVMGLNQVGMVFCVIGIVKSRAEKDKASLIRGIIGLVVPLVLMALTVLIVFAVNGWDI